MAGEIIRMGDRTSHGGIVVEGSQSDICHGKPIAYRGHKTFCPQCKGAFPIIEGASSLTFYGMGVALAGMKTACGASLIASQFTDRVTVTGNRSGRSTNSSNEPAVKSAASAQQVTYDLVFKVLGLSGTIAPKTPYKITLDDGRVFVGVTDEGGLTEKVSSDHSQSAKIEVPYYDNSSTNSSEQHIACDC